MGKKAPTAPVAGESTATATAPRKRTVRTLSPVEQAIVDDAQKSISDGKARIKEAKSLGKVIAGLAKLNDWGLQQVATAVNARRAQLAEPVAAE